jgi:hypothetical protein
MVFKFHNNNFNINQRSGSLEMLPDLLLLHCDEIIKLRLQFVDLIHLL